MSIAAVPAYLGNDFTEASPGLRFGLLLPIWTSRPDQEREVNKRAEAKSREGTEVQALLRQGMDRAIRELQQRRTRPLPGLWQKNDFAAREAWKKVTKLGEGDLQCLKALAERQTSLTNGIPADSLLGLDALATAPFTTGLGNEHPLENGFAFLNPYGLPYLPGSGVKGVLRQAARELASGDWGETQGWDTRCPLAESLARKWKRDRSQPSSAGGVGAGDESLSVIDLLFGLESRDGDTEHLRGVLTFWDVIPQIEGDSLMVEIMTPHQKHYYQDGQSPHDSGQPNPICFLTVPPGSGFTFHAICDLPRLRRLAPEFADNDRWKTLIQAAFEHAFTWLGFGAKTAVGYGAMRVDREAQAKAAKERAEREAERQREEVAAQREAALAAMPPHMKEIELLRAEIEKRLEAGRKLPVSDQFWGERIKKLALVAADSTEWTAEEKRALADMLEHCAGQLMALDAKDLRKRLKLSVLRGLA